MLDILLESRSRPPRRVRGTVVSALLHALLISMVVAVARPTRGGAVAARARRDTTIIYVAPPAERQPARTARASRGAARDLRAPAFRPPEIIVPDVRSIEVHAPPIDDDRAPCGDCATSQRPGGGSSLATGLLDGVPASLRVQAAIARFSGRPPECVAARRRRGRRAACGARRA